MQERENIEAVVDDAALWKKNRELQIEDVAEPEADEDAPPGFIDVKPEADEDAPQNENITASDVRNELNALKLAKPSASLCVSIIDIILPALVAYFYKADKQLFKLDDDEKNTLTDAFSNYLKDKNMDMSPGSILLMTIAGIYIPKIMYIKMIGYGEKA